MSNSLDSGQLLRRSSLTALQCFECAARHLNFTHAAEELHLTQSAVSHRIRNLEQQLRYKLFLRTPKQLSLTGEGRRLYDVVHHTLGQLYAELEAIDHGSATGLLVLGVVPTFARHWLVPRLADFHDKHPNIQVRIRVRASVLDFNTDPVDAAIYYDEHALPGVQTQALFDETLFPVCSRAYADKFDLWNKPENLRQCRILHDIEALHAEEVYSEWLLWLRESGNELSQAHLQRGDIFNHFDLALVAAMNHAGVAMGREQLVRSRLDRGDLVTPFGFSVKSPRCYYYLCGRENAQRPRIQAFTNWLTSQLTI
ncbi:MULTISPECIES: DNA-binding transcriptional regulator DsdC [Corallincola]|nr:MULTISPECIES: DNA-binding transcriptional regulator DsdC [Corallincola]